MTKIFTANVFLTASRSAMEKVFLSDKIVTTFDEIISSLDTEEVEKSFIVSPKHNPGLIEFVYEAKNNDVESLTMKFADTNFFIQNYIIDRYPSFNILQNAMKDLGIKIPLENVNLDINKFYVAFGIGSDVKNWAGPFRVELLRYSIDSLDDGTNQITLEFSPPYKWFLSNNIEIGKTDSLEASISRYSRINSFKKIPKSEIRLSLGVRGEDVTNNNFYGRQGFDAILKLMSYDYIKSISGSKNVIVILPKIGDLVFNDIESRYRDTISELKKTSGEVYIHRTYMERLQAAEDFPRFFKMAKDFYEKKTKLRELERIINQFGIDICETKEGERGVSPIVEENIEKEFEDTGFLLSIRSPEPDSKENDFPDFYTPLKIISDGVFNYLLNNKAGLEDRIVLHTETDIKKIKLWHKYGFIENDDDAVFIFAPKSFIENLLYLEDAFSIEDVLSQPTLIRLQDKDSQTFLNKGYRFEFFNKFKKLQGGSSFGEPQDPPDILALPDATKEYLKLTTMPVFKHNMQNSNILGLSVGSFPYLQTFLNVAIKKRLKPLVKTLPIEKIREVYDVTDYTFPEEILNSIRNRITITNKSKFNDVYQEILKLLYTTDKLVMFSIIPNKTMSDSLEIFAIRLTLAILSKENSDIPYIEIDDSDDSLSNNMLLDEELQNITFTINIKTLPFFKISGATGIRNTKCLLLSQRNYGIGHNSKKYLNYISGLCNIVGFKHVINTSECYSEFSLLKLANQKELNTNTIKFSTPLEQAEDQAVNMLRRYIDRVKDGKSK